VGSSPKRKIPKVKNPETERPPTLAGEPAPKLEINPPAQDSASDSTAIN
jgi:hypothetical protein